MTVFGQALSDYAQNHAAGFENGGNLLAGVQIEGFGALHGDAGSKDEAAADVDADDGIYRTAFNMGNQAGELVAGGKFHRVQIGGHDDVAGFNQRGGQAAFGQAELAAAFFGYGGHQLGAIFKHKRDFTGYRAVFDRFDFATELVARAGFHGGFPFVAGR